jgi:transposase
MISDSMRAEIRTELREELSAEIRLELRNELCAEIRAELRNELREKIRAELRNKLHAEIRGEIKGMLVSMQQQIDGLSKKLAEAQEQINEKDAEILRQREENNKYRRMLFGSKSEKTKYLSTYAQLSLLDVEGNKVVSKKNDSTSEIEVTGHTRKKKLRADRNDLIDLMIAAGTFPVDEEVLDLAEAEQYDENGNKMKCIGTELVRRTLEKETEKYRVRMLYKKVYAAPRNKETGKRGFVVSPEVPPAIIPHSPASASVIVDVVQKKFDYDMPLYRQERAMQDLGIPIRRNILANWVILSSEFIRKLWDRMHEELLKQSVIHSDETTIQVLNNEKDNPRAKLQMWAYASGRSSPLQIACFEYRSNRKGTNPQEFLKGYAGCVVSDGYSGYRMLKDVSRAGCFAHLRRKLFEALPTELKLAESKNDRLDNEAIRKMMPDDCIQFYLLLLINQLFAYESSYDKEQLNSAERLERRKAECAPILDEFWKRIDAMPKNIDGELKKAVTYARNQREYLMTFMTNGDVPISNNIVENTIRNFCVGRKNWLFADTEDGAEATALYYSLIVTAKANGLQVNGYLTHVLKTMSRALNEQKPLSDAEMSVVLDELMPWSPQMQARFEAPDPFHKKTAEV